MAKNNWIKIKLFNALSISHSDKQFVFQVKYGYTALNSVRVNSKVNVFGVVKFLKQPYKTRGSGRYT